MKKIFSFICSLIVVGCSFSEVSSIKNFDQKSAEGLAVIGVKGNREILVTFARYNSDTKKLDATAFSGHEQLQHDGGKSVEYKLISMVPGTYVLKSLQFEYYDGDRGFTNIYCLHKSTYMFEIMAGQILYFGDIVLERKNKYHYDVKTKEGDIEKASKVLRKYPDVEGDVVAADLTPTFFRNGTDLYNLREVCGGYYYD